ncbi:MAG: hypothetical protein ACOZBH_00955 [Patescibacteria group bacterium]
MDTKQAINYLAQSLVCGPQQALEAQERKGQEDLVASQRLPARVEPPEAKEFLEKAGVKFLGPAADPLFQLVSLPAGWTKVPTGHPWLSMLIDDRARERARIFYKDAYYDRQARLVLVPRFGVHESCHDISQMLSESEFLAYVTDGGAVTDCGKTLYVTKVVSLEGDKLQRYRSAMRAIEEARSWLEKNFPDWQNSFAYWD